MKILRNSLFVLFFVIVISPLLSCDLCSVYIAERAQDKSAHDFNVSLSEQFTHFGTLQQDGAKVPNKIGQYIESSITQVILGYQTMEHFGLQLNIPFIYRSFRRPENFITRHYKLCQIIECELV